MCEDQIQEILHKFEQKIDERLRKVAEQIGEGEIVSPVQAAVLQAKALMEHRKKQKCNDGSCKQSGGNVKKRKIDDSLV